jgi:hypothetical protein
MHMNARLGLLVLAAWGASACGRDGLHPPPVDSGTGRTGVPGIGAVVRMLPDGGLASLLGDGELADLVCGPNVKLGKPCSSDAAACVLSNLGGVCVCSSGSYLCPYDTTSGPKPCPAKVETGSPCLSPLSICIAANTACLCGVGSYTCL